MSDASFLDGAERPIKLIAQDLHDAQIISTLIQDAIAERKEMLHEPSRHAFSLLLKRFRWEDAHNAKRQNRELERVQSVLTISSVSTVQYTGFNGQDKSLAFDLLGLLPEEKTIRLIFAGDGEIKLDIETIDIALSDVSRPYIAKSKNLPHHKED